jgi:pullulanase
MVKGLHDNGISVIMDVVYNHVYNDKTFCFNQIVPGYFSRYSPKGFASAGSGCGNDTASERSMVKKYIVDSVKYWADQYHIDGFRFDLVGLIDTETINAVVEEVHKDHPNVIFYGEGWTMGTTLTKDGYTMATQTNSKLTPDFAYFSDTLRDAIRGPMGTDYKGGYLCNQIGYAPLIKDCFLGAPGWCGSPTQAINYASCHDNLALFDKITLSTADLTDADRLKMNNLSAAIVMTAQGVPFFQAGEEILRSKPDGKGGYDHNSYKSPDSINSIKWDNLNDQAYSDSYAYYQGLIAFRKAHPALRLTTAEAVNNSITVMDNLDSNVNAFHIKGGEIDDDLFVIFNPRKETTTVTLPEGKWDVYIDGTKAGTTVLRTVEGSVTVDAISALVLVQAKPTMNLWLIVGIGAAVLVLVLAVCVIAIASKKRKNKK